nr:putative leucine-rich repeat receptor-like protein kinase At2g19210 [Ipomoea batatas]
MLRSLLISLLLLCFTSSILVLSQDPQAGFITLNCGGENFTADDNTGLRYTSDATFIADNVNAASNTVAERFAAMFGIKSDYGVTNKNWQGDPCSPVSYSWNGLKCNYTPSNPPRITSIDLSNNKLTGPIPDFLSQLPSLSILNLSGNNFSGPVPEKLLQKSKEGNLTLSIENAGSNTNICQNGSCDNKKKKKNIVVPVLGSVASVLLLALAIFVILSANVLMNVHHKNLTSLVGYCIEGPNIGIIYEFMANGNLHQHLSVSAGNHNVLSFRDRLQIATDSAQGIIFNFLLLTFQ